jgi:hypothetical protein
MDSPERVFHGHGACGTEKVGGENINAKFSDLV